jgi:ABC-type sugar transport system permease subunit
MITKKSTKYYLILPLFAIFFGLMIFPTVFGWYLSFNEVFLSTFNKPVFNGIRNYIEVLSDRVFAKSLIFTFKFTLLTTLAELIIGLGMAILFNQKIQGKRFFIRVVVLSFCN